MTDLEILKQIDENIETATRLRDKLHVNPSTFHFFDGEVRGLQYLKEQIEKRISDSLDAQAAIYDK